MWTRGFWTASTSTEDLAALPHRVNARYWKKRTQRWVDYKVSWGCDLQTEHERYLTEQVFKKPVFVTDYPKEIKAFYMKMNPDNKTVAAVDCLVPGIGEIIGGSQREDDYGRLVARMDELGLKKEDYDFYLDLRKYGSTRHAGLGLGFERCVMYLTGMSNIRDVIPFPRTVNNHGYKRISARPVEAGRDSLPGRSSAEFREPVSARPVEAGRDSLPGRSSAEFRGTRLCPPRRSRQRFIPGRSSAEFGEPVSACPAPAGIYLLLGRSSAAFGNSTFDRRQT